MFTECLIIVKICFYVISFKKIGVAALYLLLGVSIFNESDYGLRFVTIYHIVEKNTVA